LEFAALSVDHQSIFWRPVLNLEPERQRDWQAEANVGGRTWKLVPFATYADGIPFVTGTDSDPGSSLSLHAVRLLFQGNENSELSNLRLN
jgi:hypothetical protein